MLIKMDLETKEIPPIVLEGVSKIYRSDVLALNDVSIRIDKGEFVFVVGTSGSGKSTFIKLVMKEIEPTKGKVFVNGRDLVRLRRKQVPILRRGIGVVFQDFRLLKDRTVFENVAFAQRIIGAAKHEINKRVPEVLALVGLSEKIHANIRELSGGEQQRVALARALVNRPTLLLADEPTGNLDPKNSWEIMELLEQINRNGTTVVVVTHNQEIVNMMKKRVIALHKGVLVSDEKKGGYSYEKN
ncbi:cell division ATP-binding protein FtsE [[Clostridium] polysaccharolyticum]|uniref:Cell division ATP-binding protein FtsE n=1 Tax=[Clostridium] polysaccharolyticum TaxID=29364 RepID=A0A1I0EP99_9FIRM|nr:cell division ATP-binding protein FtsE [[Clostridium] polysaccharolyticum]SET47314.1 cell division transport system ATP-binding protein [[Clostridium] polysaccharolyticum]